MTDQPIQKPHRKLTKKERLFVREYAKTENGTQAVLKAYDVENPKIAGVIATQNLNKLRIGEAVKVEIKRLADRIPDDLIEEKHLALLNKLDEKGDIDTHAVSKGLEMAYKVKGSYKTDDEGNSAAKPKNIYNFFFSKEAQDEVKTLEDKIKNALTQKKNVEQD